MTGPSAAHTAALQYAARGWRVFPLPPGSKTPKLKSWQTKATVDPDQIREWWATKPDHGIAIATGKESGLFVLDVDVADDKAGDETIVDLQLAHGDLPPTKTSITGSGGCHYLWRWPEGVDIRNNASTRLGPGLDIRGEGGYIVAPPSVHPYGTCYQWDLGEPDEPVEAPEWLIALVDSKSASAVADSNHTVKRDTTDRPGDLWAQATDWAEILEPDGWTLSHVDRQTGERHWTRPGKNRRDGTSATTGYTDNDHLKVFTSSMTHVGLDPEGTYSKLGYLAATRHGGDHGAAARALADAGWAPPEIAAADVIDIDSLTGPDLEPIELDPVGGWEFVDLGAILDGSYDPPTPTIGIRSDGLGLIYPGRVHSIAGEPGGGKTWLALHIITEAIQHGGTGALIDYEDTPTACVHRLKLLGLTSAQIRHQFHYIRPDGPLATKGGAIDVRTATRLQDLHADVVVIDSVGESLAVEGLPPNDDDAVTQWFRRLPRMLARTGSAVIGLDHVTKSKEGRDLWAIGSQRKLAAIDGAAYGLEVKIAPTKTKDGKLTLVCAKDRHGTYQRGNITTYVAINNVDTGVQVILTAPETRFRPTHLMEQVSRMLEDVPCASGAGIERYVGHKSQHVRAAIECLVDEKFVAKDSNSKGNQYSSIVAFREESDAVSALKTEPRPTSSHLVPTDRNEVRSHLESDLVPLVPDPLRSRGLEGTRSRDCDDVESATSSRDLVPSIDPEILEHF